MTRLIIAGGRTNHMSESQWDYLTSLSDLVDEVVSGGATGIDSMGELWAGRNKKPVKVFKADWKEHGPAAGPIRNSEMAAYANALAVFEGGSGTADMLRKAEDAGLWVWDMRGI